MRHVNNSTLGHKRKKTKKRRGGSAPLGVIDTKFETHRLDKKITKTDEVTGVFDTHERLI